MRFPAGKKGAAVEITFLIIIVVVIIGAGNKARPNWSEERCEERNDLSRTYGLQAMMILFGF
jgi:anaerobic C4-dicarboxylate transporter